MPKHETLNERVVALVREILEMEDNEAIEPHHRIREDLGMDSLGSLEMLSRLSEELRLDMDMEDAMEIATVNDACSFINRCYQEQYGATSDRKSVV